MHNHVTLAGKLYEDPQIRTVNSSRNNSPVTVMSFFLLGEVALTCEIWGRVASTLGTYLKKDMEVTVSGALQDNSYTKQDGTKVRGLKIKVTDVTIGRSVNETLLKKQQDAKDGKTTQAQAPQPEPAPVPQQPQVQTTVATTTDALPF
jgi:single-stranded DNA-binding protein